MAGTPESLRFNFLLEQFKIEGITPEQFMDRYIGMDAALREMAGPHLQREIIDLHGQIIDEDGSQRSVKRINLKAKPEEIIGVDASDSSVLFENNQNGKLQISVGVNGWLMMENQVTHNSIGVSSSLIPTTRLYVASPRAASSKIILDASRYNRTLRSKAGGGYLDYKNSSALIDASRFLATKHGYIVSPGNPAK